MTVTGTITQHNQASSGYGDKKKFWINTTVTVDEPESEYEAGSFHIRGKLGEIGQKVTVTVELVSRAEA